MKEYDTQFYNIRPKTPGVPVRQLQGAQPHKDFTEAVGVSAV